MSIGPRLIAIVLVVSASLWSLAAVTSEGEPFATDAATLLSIGLVMFALIAAVGLLIPRGRWARNLARVILGAEVLLAVALPMRSWAIAALVASAAGIIGVQGRWLDGWLRRLPAADGPGLEPMLFLLGNLALVPLIAVSSPGGVEFRQGLLAGAGLLIAWGYSKASAAAMWAGRVALAPLAVIAAAATPVAGAILTTAAGLALTWLAWSEQTRLAINPLLDKLPGPRRLEPKEGKGE